MLSSVYTNNTQYYYNTLGNPSQDHNVMYLLIQNKQHFVRHSLACTKSQLWTRDRNHRARAAQKAKFDFLSHSVSWLLLTNTTIHCHYPKPMLSEDFSSESLFVGNLHVIYALLYWLKHAHSPLLLQPEQKWH